MIRDSVKFVSCERTRRRIMFQQFFDTGILE